MDVPFQKIAAIFQEALEVPLYDREAFLERVCAGDDNLHADISSASSRARVISPVRA